MMLFSEGDLAGLGGLFGDPAHAMMIVREGGFVAEEEAWISSQILGEDNAANILKLRPAEDKKIVGADQVRSISSDVSLGSKSGDERRLVIIGDDYTMSDSAQNALLKILEEPPIGVHFLLLASSEDFFLPTVRSRCALVKLSGPDTVLVAEFSKSSLGLSAEDSSLLWLQAGGLAGSFLSLSSDEAARVKSLSVLSDAKKFVGADVYSKIATLKSYSSGRVEALEFLKSLLVVLELVASRGAKETLAVGVLVGKAERALVNVRSNGNAKLELVGLVV
jgi:DNA polymerase-3 subunit delta'